MNHNPAPPNSTFLQAETPKQIDYHAFCKEIYRLYKNTYVMFVDLVNGYLLQSIGKNLVQSPLNETFDFTCT